MGDPFSNSPRGGGAPAANRGGCRFKLTVLPEAALPGCAAVLGALGECGAARPRGMPSCVPLRPTAGARRLRVSL